MEMALDKELWPGILGYSPKPPGTPVEPATDIIIGVPLEAKSLHTNEVHRSNVIPFIAKDT